MSRIKIFNQEHIDFIQKNYEGITYRELSKMLNEKFSTNFTRNQVKRFCYVQKLSNGVNSGVFERDNHPWNKGKKWDEIMSKEAQERCRMTTYKKGNRTGRANKVYKPIGTEMSTKDGYIMVKVNDDLPFHKRWKLKHHLVWEKANGPIPPKHCIIFIDKNKSNCNLENLMLISMAENARLNQFNLRKSTDSDILKSCVLIARLTNTVSERSRNNAK